MKSGSHGMVISENNTACISVTSFRLWIDFTRALLKISFRSFAFSLVPVSFWITRSVSMLLDTIARAAWPPSIVTTQRYTDRLIARDKRTIAVRFLSFTNCSREIRVMTFPRVAFLSLLAPDDGRYPSASSGEIFAAFRTGFQPARPIVSPASNMVTAKTAG